MKYTGTLVNIDYEPDLQGEFFAEDSIIELPDHPVPISHNFDEERPSYGQAIVKRDGNRIVYEIELNEFAQDLVSSIEEMTPVMGGMLVSIKGKEIRRCVLEKVALCHNPSDTRLSKLKHNKKE